MAARFSKWAPFPHDAKAYTYAGDALKKAWPALHAGDQEPYPDEKRAKALIAAAGKAAKGMAADGLAQRLQDAWRAFHHGDFRTAYEAGEALGRQFGLKADQPLFHSVVVHFEDGEPIQVEDRYVNPTVAPDYLQMDFNSQTPNAYLMRVAPLQGVRFVIEACLPPRDVAEMLHMAPEEPCLVLRRQTHSQGQVASVAAMWHPAARYRFTGSF